MDYATTIFTVIILGFIGVSIMMQVFSRNLPQT